MYYAKIMMGFLTESRFSSNRKITKGSRVMETRVAVIGIIVENKESVPALNKLLSEYGDYIIGRMGIPYKEKKINVISIVIDAPQDVINTLSGNIGRLDGVSSKTAYSNI